MLSACNTTHIIPLSTKEQHASLCCHKIDFEEVLIKEDISGDEYKMKWIKKWQFRLKIFPSDSKRRIVKELELDDGKNLGRSRDIEMVITKFYKALWERLHYLST